MFKFREPKFVEYVLFDLENFPQKSKREKVAVCLRFLQGSINLDDLTMEEADTLIRQFSSKVLAQNVIPMKEWN